MSYKTAAQHNAALTGAVEFPAPRASSPLHAMARRATKADELEAALWAALPIVEDAASDDGYKPGYIAKVLRQICAALDATDPQMTTAQRATRAEGQTETKSGGG